MKRITRRDFVQKSSALAASTFLDLGISSNAYAKEENVERPNILWITMEDTCPQFLGCYGNKSAHTPNMDRLASEGVRFTRAFSTAPVCAPSRSTIITGCLPEVIGSANHRSEYPIPEFIKGFPYYLRRAGYFTSNNLKTDYNIGNAKEFIAEAWDECHGAGGWGTSYGHNSDTFDENSHEAGWWHRKPGQPFFSVFNLFNSHQSRTMTLPHAWYDDNVLNHLATEQRISADEVTMPPFYRNSPEMREHMSRVYNSLQLTDLEFGRILDQLEKDGLKENTIVFCFADHGEGIPRCKTSAVGMGFQVPFFVYFPPKYRHLSPWPIGKPTAELVSSSEDAAPTVLSLAGVDIPEYMHGRPLLGRARQSPRPFVWHGRSRIDESPGLTRALSDGRYFYARVFMPQLPLVKFIKYMNTGDIMRTLWADHSAGRLNALEASLIDPRQPNEYLFDLNDDPWQIHNLAEDGAYEEKLAHFRRALQSHLKEIRDVNFMPEYELAARSKSSTPYQFRKDDDVYPFEKILAVANMAGDNEAVPQQIAKLKDENGIVRYWAAIGLDAQGDAVKPFKQKILESLDDPYPPAQIAIAGIAYKVFQSKKAAELLRRWASAEDTFASLQAVQTIEYMRNNAKPFSQTLQSLLSETPGHKPAKKGHLNYMVKWATQVTLHFLNGAPLFYQAYAKWTSKAHLEPDPSVHF